MIRTATVHDAAEILDIYKYYIENTAITLECVVPTVEQFAQRIENTLKKYPYLVAEQDGEIIGYAYAGPLNVRQAFDWSVECSIYVKAGLQKKGLGRELYSALENALALQNIINLSACIAYPEVEDEYLNYNSVQFHSHFGYSMVGEFHKCGYKFGRWYGMVWMEKFIGEHNEPKPFRVFDDIRAELLEKYGIK